MAVLVLASGANVFAQGPGGRRGPMGRGGALFPLRMLNLSDGQQRPVKDMMARHRPEMEAAGKRVQAAREAQRKAVTAIPYDEGAIRFASDLLASATGDAGVLRARVRSEVWTLLTPEQQTKVKDLEAERATKQSERQNRREKFQQRRRPSASRYES
jgi:protein CpxP